MSWYDVVDYNMSFHETNNISVWLHIGPIELVPMEKMKVKVNNITYYTKK